MRPIKRRGSFLHLKYICIKKNAVNVGIVLSSALTSRYLKGQIVIRYLILKIAKIAIAVCIIARI